ncbi:ATP-binding SpoIIE family protein phosphatase [Micromonospora avicenniae]|uniref:Histidine kinase-like ATPase domain-containing protein n=1 Tax=Micromonospora avicenniae TaxID=1198245 RepID=A0A1N7EYD9_9ACTN|nr:SpoIIE family protein phosphatase [Micromonospora avicenniae]SIR93099.1 Histidine kinase-like ATPase domain-containing protein [Micromonospora avicenniae]
MSSALGDAGAAPLSAADAELPPQLAAAFAAGGEMGRRLANFDWSGTPLGHPRHWPAALVNAVGMMLASSAQIVMFWGEDELAFYNDAYLPTIGGKHPDALCQPARTHWAETWDVLAPLLAGVRRTGRSYHAEDHPFLLDRHGFLEQTYFNVSYDPVRVADGSVGGVFCIVAETTGRVLGERRLRLLAELGSELADVGTAGVLGQAVAAVLDRHRSDVPFAQVWLRDEAQQLTLVGHSGGVPPAAAPAALVRALDDRVGGVEAGDLLDEPPVDAADRALVLPITAANQTAGALVVGVSRRLPLTGGYRDLFNLVAVQISRSVERGQIIRRLRALADAAVAVNTARSTADVLRVAARHALDLVEMVRVVVTAGGIRAEEDTGDGATTDPSFVLPLTGTGTAPLGELRVWGPAIDGAETDEAALTQLARLVGVRLENAQLFEAEHRVATTLQHSLLPRSLPRLAGAVVASRYLPGTADVEVGGDWYDAIVLNDQELVLVIGDVVGKGVQAAAAMGQLRNALRAYLLEGFDPGESLTRLNRLVASTEHRSFATVFCLLFHPGTGRLRYASAGHPSPLLIGGGGVTFLHDRALGPPVGAVPDGTYRTVEGELRSGRRLLLYTDGLIEDRQVDIDEALAQLCVDAAGPSEHVADLIDAVLGQVDGRPRRDDVAVIALEAAEPHRFSLRLPADPARLSVLRKRLEDFLVAHGVGETDLFDLTVAISEAAANAIEHPVDPAEPTIGVEVAIEERTVVATVRDSGRWREPTGAGFRGRGLSLIRALGELSVGRTPTGTEVTLRRRLQE